MRIGGIGLGIKDRVETSRNAAGVGIAAGAELPRRGGGTRFGPAPAEHALMGATK